MGETPRGGSSPRRAGRKSNQLLTLSVAMSDAVLEQAQVAEPSETEAYVPTILTVDDEPSVLSALRRLFRLQGYKTLQATSGAEGLELFKANRVDLVISDMRMPEMDGARFLELVREHDASVSRILLTGYADMTATIEAINKGAIHRYIAKPWEDQDLVLVVRDALERRGLERRNAELVELTRMQNDQLREANQTLEARVASRTDELQQINGMLEASYEELDQTFMLSVGVFSSLMEMRDGGTGHARRIADLCRATAVKLGLSEREARDVFLAALVHDVGTIGFPDAMLNKPVSAYTLEEMARYRRHSVDGETALMPLMQLQGVAKIVRQHHERFDGKGFPDGLAGEAISIGARIVAPASDMDELMNGALGETRYSEDRVRQMLRSGADSRYDRAVIEALILVMDETAVEAKKDRLIGVFDLRPGMVLAKDLVSASGAILLAKGFVFDDRVVKRVTDFAKREGVQLTLRVQRAVDEAATVEVASA
jgi:response regulator RpfG family c-di-GMP phosphodiesterase